MTKGRLLPTQHCRNPCVFRDLQGICLTSLIATLSTQDIVLTLNKFRRSCGAYNTKLLEIHITYAVWLRTANMEFLFVRNLSRGAQVLVEESRRSLSIPDHHAISWISASRHGGLVMVRITSVRTDSRTSRSHELCSLQLEVPYDTFVE